MTPFASLQVRSCEWFLAMFLVGFDWVAVVSEVGALVWVAVVMGVGVAVVR